MELFRNRPAALAGCVFALTSFLLVSLEGGSKCILMLGGALFLLLLLLYILLARGFCRTSETLLLCTLAILLALGSSYLYFNRYAERLYQQMQDPVAVEGLVLSREKTGAYETVLRVRLTSVDDEDCRARAILRCSSASSLQAGDLFCATVGPADETGRSAESDTYHLADGFLLSLSCVAETPVPIGRSARDPIVLLSRWNLTLSTRLAERIGGEEGALAAALLLGNRSLLSDDTSLAFRRAGISHLLALSGLHASVLIGALELLLRRCRVPRRLRAVIIPAAAFGYLFLTGASPSIIRAVLLVTVSYLGFLLGESYDPFTALAVALSLMLLVMPYAVLDLSLWMSFLAASGIVIFLPALTERWQIRGRLRRPPLWVRAGRALLTALAVGVAANLSILLLSAYVFGSISLTSVPATILLSPLTEALLILSVLALLFPAPWLHALAALLGRLLLGSAARISELSGILVPTDAGGVHLLFVLATLLAVLFAVIRLRHRLWLLLPVALALVGMLLPGFLRMLPENEGTLCYYTCTEEGGQTLLLTSRMHTVAVDLSNGDPSNALQLLALVESAGHTELEDLILVRCYRQQTYALSILSTEIKLYRLHLPPPQTPHEQALAERIAEEARAHGVTVLYDAGEVDLPLLTARAHAVERNDREETVGIFYSFRAGGITLSCVNGTFDASHLSSRAYDAYLESRLLWIGQQSPTKEGWRLPRQDALSMALFARERHVSRLPWWEESSPSVVGNGVWRIPLLSLGEASPPPPQILLFCQKQPFFECRRAAAFHMLLSLRS